MKVVAVFTLALAAAAQTPKAPDNCAPPPSALAPTLPARLLPGMGTVHLAITTVSPEAQQFFDQGVAQMHSFWAREAERSFLQAAALDPAALRKALDAAQQASLSERKEMQALVFEIVAKASFVLGRVCPFDDFARSRDQSTTKFHAKCLEIISLRAR